MCRSYHRHNSGTPGWRGRPRTHGSGPTDDEKSHNTPPNKRILLTQCWQSPYGRNASATVDGGGGDGGEVARARSRVKSTSPRLDEHTCDITATQSEVGVTRRLPERRGEGGCGGCRQSRGSFFVTEVWLVVGERSRPAIQLEELIVVDRC